MSDGAGNVGDAVSANVPAIRPDLRHHPARRGAGSRHRAHEGREGRDRRAARPAERRHPRSRVPDLLATASSTRCARSPTTVKGPVIAALARTATGDIERAAEALKGADRWRIHTFISTSDVQRESMLKMSYDQVLERDPRERDARQELHRGRGVQRAGRDAHPAGVPARVLPARGASAAPRRSTCPTPSGYATPTEFGELIRIVRDQTPDDVVDLDALPQRPRARGRELAGRHRERRRAGRGRGQRHRRARGQLLARGDRHGRAHPRPGARAQRTA